MSDAIRAVGMMSGTSMDGIDLAEVVTDGTSIQEFGASHYIPYAPEERQILGRAMGKWDGLHVRAAERLITRSHALAFAKLDVTSVDVIGFHGQTLAHDPDNRRTLQVGDGVQLAREAGFPVVWDFRSADVALGGAGGTIGPLFSLCLRQIHRCNATHCVFEFGRGWKYYLCRSAFIRCNGCRGSGGL